MAAADFRLGVDFGTSNTVAALSGVDGRVRVLLFDGSPLLASAVLADPDGVLLTGADAVRVAVGHPAGLEANPKQRIDDGVVWLADREIPVTDAIAAVLRRVADEATRVAGGPVQDVILTHPAAWGAARTGVLTAAAAQVGWERAHLVAEPVAAAAYFAAVLAGRIRTGRHVVIYDLGAGTFDVTVVRRGMSTFEVVSTDGLDDVGGLHLDAAVVEHARTHTNGDAGEAWTRLDWPSTRADQYVRQNLWQAARAVKEHLSRHSAADLHVPLVDRQIHLTRAEFEQAAGPMLDRTATLTRHLLATARVPPETIDAVFLVGGSSRIPLVATTLHRALRIAPTVLDHPELVVAEGAVHATLPSPGDSDPTSTPPAARQAPDLHPAQVTVGGASAGTPDTTAQPKPVTTRVTPKPRRTVTPAPRAEPLPRRQTLRRIALWTTLALVAATGWVTATRPWEHPDTGTRTDPSPTSSTSSPAPSGNDPSAAAIPAIPTSKDICGDTELLVSAATEKQTVPQGTTVTFFIRIKNISTRQCRRDLSAAAQEIYLERDTIKVWSSDACSNSSSSADVRTLTPNIDHQFNVPWNGQDTAAGCTNRTNVEPGVYILRTRLGNIISEPVPVEITG